MHARVEGHQALQPLLVQAELLQAGQLAAGVLDASRLATRSQQQPAPQRDQLEIVIARREVALENLPVGQLLPVQPRCHTSEGLTQEQGEHVLVGQSVEALPGWLCGRACADRLAAGEFGSASSCGSGGKAGNP